MPFRVAAFVALLVALAGFCLVAGGCAGMGLRRPSGTLVTRSADGQKSLAPSFSKPVYAPTDVAAAEIYLTDLPQDRLLDASDRLVGLSGTIVQIRLFIVPRAGNTPIGDTACNVTLRQIVLSSRSSSDQPEIGVYGGGGFLFPSGQLGDKSISGTMSDVTVRLLESTPGFSDLLGAAEASGGFTAQLDAKATQLLAARFQRLLNGVERPDGLR